MRTLFHILLFLPIVAFSQGTPQGINYQAVAYDSEGYEISNKDISVRLGILLGGVDAEASYTEVHSVTTDDFGLFSLVISEGLSNDDFSSIHWEEGAFLKVEVDEDLDGEYSVMGVSSFNAVPYALSAPTSDDILIRINELENKIDSLKNRVKIGDYAHGGIVFYVDKTGEHGLVAAEFDIPTPTGNIWELGCAEMETTNFATGHEIGDGYQNTMDIINNDCQQVNNYNDITGAQACIDFQSNGYTDWYIPSLDELTLIYMNLVQTINTQNPPDDYTLYNFDRTGWYWSSTIKANSSSYGYMLVVTQGEFWHTWTSNPARIRPIRSF